MPYQTLNTYLASLAEPNRPASSVWLDRNGQALGRFFNCTITSAFQPIRENGSARVVAYEGLARSASADDAGLSLWKLLHHAASDDESIELDRLCRMLHAINFFRQEEAGAADLFLNVHDRLLSAVSSNHGYAFQRILDALGLPMARIVLQLPATSAQQGWLLNYVADNYRRNGFRLALNAATPAQALAALEQLHPDAIKLDARHLSEPEALAPLLRAADGLGVRVIFKRVETALEIARLQAAATGSVYAQGYVLDQPQPQLQQAPPGKSLPATLFA
jgi:EAL domain-containing protein (putative c-di-GMP-specific phosphodiesterase class I)